MKRNSRMQSAEPVLLLLGTTRHVGALVLWRRSLEKLEFGRFNGLRDSKHDEISFVYHGIVCEYHQLLS